MESPDFYPKLFSFPALQRAWLRVAESDGCAGIDRVTIGRFGANLAGELGRLEREILGGSYRPLPLLRFFVPKAGGGERALNVAAVRDRVAQHAVIGHLEPIFEREFEDCSFGYRRGRSVKQALSNIEFLRDSGYTWVVEADISAYFDCVDHRLLFAALEQAATDARLRALVRLWVEARVYDGRRLWQMERGLPQGAPVSPLLANLYLDRFDEQILAGNRKLVRFADDFVILCKSKPKAEAALRLTRRLIAELKLTLNEEKTRVTTFAAGFKYLGAVFTGGFCFASPPGRADAAPVKVPPRLFPASELNRIFNTELSDDLKTALTAPENDCAAFEFSQQSEAMTNENPAPTPAPTAENDLSQSDFAPPAVCALRTLYVHEHGATIRCANERLEIVKDEAELLSLPLRKIEQIVLFGNSQITASALKNCLKQNIPILIFSGRGRFLGSAEARGGANVLLQRLQFDRLRDADFVADTARRIVAGKINNCRALLQRRGGADKPQIAGALDGSARCVDRLWQAQTLDEIRGCEGAASAAYFAGLSACFAAPFEFVKRTRRPPQDPVNALLSFGYAMLFENIRALAQARGLSPDVGALHDLRPGHPALCSDLIEEFRAPVVDALVTTVVNKKIFLPEDFYFENSAAEDLDDENAATNDEPPPRACRLTDAARRKFVAQFEQRMNTEVRHKHAEIKTSWRGCIDLQIAHLIKVLRGEAPHYIPIEFR